MKRRRCLRKSMKNSTTRECVTTSGSGSLAITTKAEIHLLVGGFRRQSSNTSSTIKSDRQISTRRRRLRSSVTTSNAPQKLRHVTSRCVKKDTEIARTISTHTVTQTEFFDARMEGTRGSHVDEENFKGQIELLDGQRTKTPLSARKKPSTRVTIFTNV